MKTQPVNSTDIIFKGKLKIKHFKIIIMKKKKKKKKDMEMCFMKK